MADNLWAPGYAAICLQVVLNQNLYSGIHKLCTSKPQILENYIVSGKQESRIMRLLKILWVTYLDFLHLDIY